MGATFKEGSDGKALAAGSKEGPLGLDKIGGSPPPDYYMVEVQGGGDSSDYTLWGVLLPGLVRNHFWREHPTKCLVGTNPQPNGVHLTIPDEKSRPNSEARQFHVPLNLLAGLESSLIRSWHQSKGS